MAHHDVRLRLFHRHLDLAVDGEGAGEFPFRNNVAETKAAAIVPGGIIDHLGAHFLHDAGGYRDPVAIQHIVVVDHILGHHLVDMAGRMNGDPDIRGIDGLSGRDPGAHDMQPFGIVDDFLGDQQLAVDQAVQLGQDFPHLLAQFRRMHQKMAHFLVIAERRAAMHQGVIMARIQAFRLGRDIGLVKIAQKDGGQGDDIANARAMIIPGRARGLIGFVQIARLGLVHQPQQGRRIAWNIAALAAGFVMPKLVGGNFLVPAIQRLGQHRFMLLADPMDDDLAVFFQLPHDIAHILDPVLVGQQGAFIDLRLDPGCRGARLLGAQLGIAPFFPMTGKSFAVIAHRPPQSSSSSSSSSCSSSQSA